MNRFFLDAIEASGISAEIIAATQLIAADRTVATPQVLVDFTMYTAPVTPPSNTERNTTILAMLAHYALVER